RPGPSGGHDVEDAKDVIENGNFFNPVHRITANADGTSTSTISGLVTAEEKAQKKNDRIGKKIIINGSDTAGYDKTKSYMGDDEVPTNMALMAFSDSEAIKNMMEDLLLLQAVLKEAINDEFNLWHRRLGHIKFKTMNKLMKGNLVRGLPSKIFENDHTYVACQKGKQHKASWIKRIFSNARSPQQNRVAERKNKTLIEAARTMLADSLLPIPFWAEAVNTACYVHNMVFMTKPHNITPYELLIGRAPIISFMRPFGYPVTILNTLDHLGKFNGKADEGFLVGYFINRKAFKVYNSITKKVEENMHVNFLENKPNVTRSGLECLFNIDSLTNSMNYQPISAGNRTNGITGSKIHFDAGQEGKEKMSNQEYILLPVLNTSLDVPSSNEKVESSAKDDVGNKSIEEPTCVEGGKIDDLGCLDQQMKSIDDSKNTNSINSFNTASPTVNTASDKDGTFQRTYGEWNFSTPIPVNAAGSSFSHLAALDDLSKIPNLEDTGIFDDAYDDKDEGAKADYNNLETIEPKKVTDALDDKSWVEAMQEELLQFKLLNVWTLMCDKKNSVLFTKTECLVLSLDFKLPDENQVLLKAINDEFNLWHRRLGHIKFKTMNKLMKGNLVRGLPSKIFENDHTCVACQKGKQYKASSKKDKTSGILKDFITEIETQLNHKVKIIRCDNGTEFKNYEMNQFCEIKGIKREFSNARTPQKNGVAKRKHRTLIEAARTMLEDSLLPIPFWAEAVNTACYVQNRVLVTKPHNKTPYELLIGSDPEWLFDIDSLTNSMTYQPVSVGNRTNGIAGSKIHSDARQEGKAKVSDQEYILLPVLNTSLDVPSRNEEVVSSPKDDAGKNPTVNTASAKDGTFQGTFQRTYGEWNFSTPITVNAVGSSFSYPTTLDDFSKMPNLEDTRIFDDAYDDRDEGAEADYDNLETMEPKNVTKALDDESWVEAMQEELL
nr:hypothetical protein [Tanacetum cinerariifolium]